MDKQTPDLQPDAAGEGRFFTAETDLEPADLSEIERGRSEQLAQLAPAVTSLGGSMHLAANTHTPTSVFAQTSENANQDQVPTNEIANKVEPPRDSADRQI